MKKRSKARRRRFRAFHIDLWVRDKAAQERAVAAGRQLGKTRLHHFAMTGEDILVSLCEGD